MLAYLEPVDTLFFRDNRPFEAGNDAFAESTLPSPLTIFGALGDYFLKQNGTDLGKFRSGAVEDPILGKYDSNLINTRLKIHGIFFSWQNRKYLPSPSNLFIYDSRVWTANPSENKPFKWDIEDDDLMPLNLPPGKSDPVEGYLSIDEINEKYLLNKQTNLNICNLDKFFVTEQRFGHKLDRNTLVVEEGFLYSAAHFRFQEELGGIQYEKVKLGAVISDIVADEAETVINLGGEGKKVKLTLKNQQAEEFKNDEVLSLIKNNKRFFVYLLTPAIFHGGYTRKEWPPDFKGATLKGAAVKKPVYISGWQRTKESYGFPRPLKNAAPQGSVYFFQASGWAVEQFDRLYNTYNMNTSLSEEYPCAGFGISLIGSW